MDDLVEKAIQRLKDRQNRQATITFNASVQPPAEQIFVDHGKIVVENPSVVFITDLYSMNKHNEWVAWLLTGISYDVQFYFEINAEMVNFVPRLMILDWPIIFVVNGEQPLIASRNQTITRAEIAALPDHSILVKYHHQNLDDEAKDICRYKNITIKVRTEENCIWQK